MEADLHQQQPCKKANQGQQAVGAINVFDIPKLPRFHTRIVPVSSRSFLASFGHNKKYCSQKHGIICVDSSIGTSSRENAAECSCPILGFMV